MDLTCHECFGTCFPPEFLCRLCLTSETEQLDEFNTSLASMKKHFIAPLLCFANTKNVNDADPLTHMVCRGFAFQFKGDENNDFVVLVHGILQGNS